MFIAKDIMGRYHFDSVSTTAEYTIQLMSEYLNLDAEDVVARFEIVEFEVREV